MWAPCLSYVMQGIKPRVYLCVPDKRFTNQTICTSCLVCLTSRKKSVNSTFLGTPRNSDFFAGLEEGDQGSGYEPYLKMIFAAAPTEAQVQLGLLILSDLETCFSPPPPELTVEDTEDVTVGSQISTNDTTLLQPQQAPSRTG